jgi:hypothetical protein
MAASTSVRLAADRTAPAFICVAAMSTMDWRPAMLSAFSKTAGRMSTSTGGENAKPPTAASST